MKIKIRAFDAQTHNMVTEESSGLHSYEILKRFDCVMLFANTNDCNEKEVYEGDILRVPVSGNLFEVKWNDNEMRWNMYDKNGNCYNMNMPLLQVVGNIYENIDMFK